jgi:putative ABC transport system permease protein
MTFVGLAARNLLRNRFRTLLTVVGIALSILTFITLRTVVYAWTVAVEVAPKDRIVTRHKITFVMTLPRRYVDTVRQTPGVRAATFANWFGGKDPKHEREFFSTLAIDTDTAFEVYSEVKVPAEQLTAWKADRAGAVVGDALAKKLGWKLGDRVTLESSIFPSPPDNPWTFTIRGIYTATAKSVDRYTFFFHWSLLNERIPEARKDQIGWTVARIEQAGRAAEVSQAIDRAFEPQEIQTLSQDERSFNASFLSGVSAVLSALDLVSAIILGIMCLILGNTIAMGVRERTNEYGAMRALGFSRGHLFGFVLGESVVAGLLGGAVGILLAYPIVERGMGRWLEENMGAYFPYFRVELPTVLLAMGLVLVLSVLSGFIPAWQAARLRVTDALRQVR